MALRKNQIWIIVEIDPHISVVVNNEYILIKPAKKVLGEVWLTPPPQLHEQTRPF